MCLKIVCIAVLASKKRQRASKTYVARKDVWNFYKEREKYLRQCKYTLSGCIVFKKKINPLAEECTRTGV